jgi:hypothetical protein
VGGFAHLLTALGSAGKGLVSDPVPFAARVALAALLLTAGVYKLRHPWSAALSAVNFRVVSTPSRIVGYAIGTAETLAAVTLLAPWPAVALAGCVLAGCLSVSFAVLSAAALRRNDRFACHCLSGADDNVSWATVTRAVAMVATAAVGVVGPVARSVALPGGTDAVLAIGLAAVMLGLPATVYRTWVVWRRYRTFVHDIDWEWVFAVRSGRAAIRVPKERSHAH